MASTQDTTAGFRTRARRLHRWRRGLAWVWDAALALVTASILGTAVTTWSQRGDLAAFSVVSGLLGYFGARALLTWSREASLRRRAGADPQMVVALRVLDTPGPLADPPLNEGPDGDALLRHELVSATSLEAELQGGGQSRMSPELARTYIASVGQRLAAAEVGRAVPPFAFRARMLSSVVLAAICFAGLTTPSTAQAFEHLLAARDASPPPPPERIWSRMELHLSYPAHSARASRRVPNPSGALRVLAGTEVTVEFWTRRDAPHARVLLAHRGTPDREAPVPEIIDLEVDEQADADETTRHFKGNFTVRGAADWTVLLFEDLEDAPTAHAPPAVFELELDAPPEVELDEVRDEPREASEIDELRVGFKARDDFGLRSAQLVYRRADGSLHHVPVDPGPPNERRWSRRARLDLSSIPIDERGELEYWIEVRDNDPGLGFEPLVDPPGKVGSSAHQTLKIRDREKEHAVNVESLRQLRDAFVDILAARLGSRPIFEAPRTMLAELLEADPESPAIGELEEETRRVAIETRALGQLRAARSLHEASASVLAMLSQSIDRLSVDPLARERDLRQLAAMHARLLELHRVEDELHTRLPEGSDLRAAPQRIGRLLGKLGRHDRKEQTQLEDEIIRLDDLVDGELIRQIEALTARLQASQQKLVELLEQLKAGDESVRPQIDELEARIREDMRRYQELRQQLSKEVGDEFFNRDAFANLEALMRRQGVLKALQEGDIDKALQQAREGLEEMRSVNEAVQQRAGEEGEDARLDPIEAARMKLLRELGRLRDLQGGLVGSAGELHERWRESVSTTEASEDAALRKEAAKLLEALDDINDARLSRQGRERLEDAREALRKLEASQPESGALPRWEAAFDAARGLEGTMSGLTRDDDNVPALEKLARRAGRLEDRLRAPLAPGAESLDEAALESARARSQEQRALEGQAQELLRSELWEGQPEAALEHLEDAAEFMGEAVDPFASVETIDARSRTRAGAAALKKAIDALRQSTPPPQSSAAEDSSTEAERDRSLRDQVVEAMREGRDAPLEDSVSRYYEELLK